MSTRPDPERSGAVEIATRRRPRLRVVWDLRELTHKQKPRLWSLPVRLGPITVHPTRWGVGRQLRSRIVVVFVVQRIDRYSYFCAYLLMLLDQGLLSQLDFYLIKERCHFSNRESDRPSRQILGYLIKDRCHFSI